MERAVSQVLFHDWCTISLRPFPGPQMYATRHDILHHQSLHSAIDTSVRFGWSRLKKYSPRKEGGSAHKFEIDDHFQSSLCVGIVALRCKFYVVTRGLISKTMIQSVLIVSMTGTNLPSPIATHASGGIRLADCQRILLQDTRPMEEIYINSRQYVQMRSTLKNIFEQHMFQSVTPIL